MERKLLLFITIIAFSLYGWSQNNLDSLTYSYSSTKNQLTHVNDNVAAANWSTDVDNQTSTNYAYNAIGQLTKDEAAGIKALYWNLKGNVKRIIKANGDTLNFTYNTLGKREKKELISNDTIYQTVYSYYPMGGIAAVYEKKYRQGNKAIAITKIKENHLQSSSRLGIYNVNESIFNYSDTLHTYTRILQNKKYELTDHLDNVVGILTDELNADYDGEHLISVSNELENASRYYAYGMQQPGRYYSNATYRYGVQGKENDSEIKGEGNSYDFGARMLDTRLGRWLSRDNYESMYPALSPYCAMGNNPISYIDPDGNTIYIFDDLQQTGSKTFQMLYATELGKQMIDELNETGHAIIVTMENYKNASIYGKTIDADFFLEGIEMMQNSELSKGLSFDGYNNLLKQTIPDEIYQHAQRFIVSINSRLPDLDKAFTMAHEFTAHIYLSIGDELEGHLLYGEGVVGDVVDGSMAEEMQEQLFDVMQKVKKNAPDALPELSKINNVAILNGVADAAQIAKKGGGRFVPGVGFVLTLGTGLASNQSLAETGTRAIVGEIPNPLFPALSVEDSYDIIIFIVNSDGGGSENSIYNPNRPQPAGTDRSEITGQDRWK